MKIALVVVLASAAQAALADSPGIAVLTGIITGLAVAIAVEITHKELDR
ncbi:hypothetical protein [Thermomonospora amylolytica]|nr:hypothetical protein [Thermomonospora amylolytica]